MWQKLFQIASLQIYKWFKTYIFENTATQHIRGGGGGNELTHTLRPRNNEWLFFRTFELFFLDWKSLYRYILIQISPTFVLKGSFNSLVPVKFEWNLRWGIFKLILVICGWGSSCEIALGWLSLNLTDDRLILVSVMAWCWQANIIPL